MDKTRSAKFTIGQVVKHRVYPFRGVIFDIDPVFNNTEEWWQAIPAEIRPHKDQPFYHLFAENSETEYIAYVSEQNLLPDTSGKPIRHPDVADVFVRDESGTYRPRTSQVHYFELSNEKARLEAAPLIFLPVERLTSLVPGPARAPVFPEPGSAGLRVSCAPLRLSSAALPGVCAAAPRTLSDRWAARHRPSQNHSTAAEG